VRETLLGVKRVAQPKRRINAAGDCFACATAAVVNYLCPRHKPLTVKQAWKLFEGQDSSGNRTTNNTWRGIEHALVRARHDLGRPIETKTLLSHVPAFEGRWGGGYCFPWQEAGTFYAEHLEAWLSAGWVAITIIDHDGNGLFDEELRVRGGDHFVVLDGARLGWGVGPHEGAYDGEIHVVCSSKTNLTGWHHAQTFERRHGGMEWLLARRDRR
jgi:hypothetical protein